MKHSKIVLIFIMVISLCITVTSGFAAEAKTTDSMSAAEKEKHKAHIQKHKAHILDTADKTLKELYEKQPDAKKAVEEAYGYAVFTNTGYNLLIFVGGTGHGVAFNNSDKKPVFMSMHKAGTGPGLGYVKYRQVITFANKILFDEFSTIGMQGSASANLTVKTDSTGSDSAIQMSLVPGVFFYQITDAGIDLQANWGGMMYLKDSELN